jgi:hypothetical protein
MKLSMYKRIRWVSLLIIIQVFLGLFLVIRPAAMPSGAEQYQRYLLAPIIIISVIFSVAFFFTFSNHPKIKSVLRSVFEDAMIPFVILLIVIGFLAMCATIYFVLADTLEVPIYHHLMPVAVLAYTLSWEVLILLSYTRKEMRDKSKFWIWLPLLLAANYFLWHKLANVGRYLQPNLPNVYPDETIKVFSTYKWWQLMLPIREFKNNWPFGLVLTYLFENLIGTAGVWYVYQAILILSAFFLSWKVFRSPIFSYILAICLGFGTHHYHAFQYSGITGFYLMHALMLILLYLSYVFIRSEGKNLWCLAGVIPTLLLTAIYYEGWLDFFASVFLITIFLYFYFKHHQQPQYNRSLFILFAIFNIVFAAYITISFTYTEFAHDSGESALVLFYGKDFFWRAVDDLISNYFTNLYVTLTNFLPPALITSNALYQYSDQLAGRNPLTYYHYFFWWRYLAGAAAMIFYGFFIKQVKKSFSSELFSTAFPIVIFSIMVAINGATHHIIQFLPARSMPVFGYYVQQGVLGFSLLIAYGMHLYLKNARNKKQAAILVALVIGIILWSSIRRPNYLWHMIEMVGIDHQGPYPNPLNTLIITIRRVFFPNFLL